MYNYQTEIVKIREQFAFDFVALSIADHTKEFITLKWQYVAGNLNDRYKRITLHSGKGIAGMVWKTGKPMLLHDVDREIPAEQIYTYPIIVSERLKSMGAVPLWENKRVAGVLLVGFRDKGHLTNEMFAAFQQSIDPNFGRFVTKEM